MPTGGYTILAIHIARDKCHPNHQPMSGHKQVRVAPCARYRKHRPLSDATVVPECSHFLALPWRQLLDSNLAPSQHCCANSRQDINGRPDIKVFQPVLKQLSLPYFGHLVSWTEGHLECHDPFREIGELHHQSGRQEKWYSSPGLFV